jgi:hypothetical protein
LDLDTQIASNHIGFNPPQTVEIRTAGTSHLPTSSYFLGEKQHWNYLRVKQKNYLEKNSRVASLLFISLARFLTGCE